MSRRRFLSGLSTLGLSGAALNHITQDAVADLTDNPEKEVPRLEGFKHTNQKELRDSSTKDPVKPEKSPFTTQFPEINGHIRKLPWTRLGVFQTVLILH